MTEIKIPSDASINIQNAFRDVQSALRGVNSRIGNLDLGARRSELDDLRREVQRLTRKPVTQTWADVFGTMLPDSTVLGSYYGRDRTRGMRLRTHPDIDLAASNVQLQGAGEIVYDDGFQEAITEPLTANLADAGKGGLDTGAEAASTWYEIYAVRQRDSGTKGLLFHRAKNYLLDESYTAGEDGQHTLRRAGAPLNSRLGQGFQVSNTGLIEFVDVKLIRLGAVAAGKYVTMSILANAAGVPTGASLATSDKIDASKISTTAQWIRFVFRTPFTATAATQYHLVISGDYTLSDTVHISWRADTTGGAYASGSKSAESGGVWTADADDDFMFKVYVTQNDTAVVMPDGYNQKCLLGYVYNDSSSNLKAFMALDRLVSALTIDAIPTTASTIPELTDVSAYIPPLPVAFSVGVFNTTVSTNLVVAPVPDGYGTIGGNRDGGAARFNQPATVGTTVAELLPILTETQGIYQMTSGGTLNSYVAMWRW